MAGLTEIREIWTPRMLSVFRIVVALLYLQHPMAKFFAFPHLAAFDNLQPFSLIWVAGVIELVGSLLLLVGLFTRPDEFTPAAWHRNGHESSGAPDFREIDHQPPPSKACLAQAPFDAVGTVRLEPSPTEPAMRARAAPRPKHDGCRAPPSSALAHPYGKPG